MKPVRQFYQNHTDVLCHGKKHFPQIFCLNFHFIRRIIQLAKLCHTVYQKLYFIAELFADLFGRHHGVFHHIVEKSCHNGLFVKLQIGQNQGHTQRMNDIRLPGFAELALMSLPGNPICFFYHRNICGRMIFFHTVNQFIIQNIRTGKIRHGFYIGIRFFYFISFV